MRKAILLLAVFLTVAAVTAVLGRDRWPGPHPRAVATLEQRREAREAALRTTLVPANAGPANRFADGMKAVLAPYGYNVMHHDLAAPGIGRDFPLGASFDAPMPLAGRSLRDVLDESLRRAGADDRVALVWTDLGLLVTRPNFGNDLNMAQIEVASMNGRWWSPRLLWARATASDGPLPVAHATLVYERIKREVAPDSWATQAIPAGFAQDAAGGGTLAFDGRGMLQVINTNANVAAVQDLVWWMKFEAAIFDASTAGLAAAMLLGLAMGVHAAVRRRRRSRAGLCLGCGYDLRASPAQCPECGRPSRTPATGSAAASAS